jgi:hypothetical protein
LPARYLASARHYSRRSLLAAGGALGAGVLLAACTSPPRGQPAAESGPREGTGAALQPANPAAPLQTGPGPAVGAAPAINTPAPPAREATATGAPRPNGLAPEATPTASLPPPTATSAPSAPTATPSPMPLVYEAARLKDRLGAAQTSYAGSIAERAWNVELATKRLAGTRIAPGEVFSFNRAVGPTTIKTGFRIGYGITMKDGDPETIPSVGGGICQVATTVFQAAFWAGLPFVERHHHLYWIPRYGQPPSGRTGMDATVDDPGVDLKFRNTTDDWIRLDGWTDGKNVGFTIVGVDPGWEVELIKPKIFEVVKTNPEHIRQDDPTMPAGKEVWVEHAEDGFKVTVGRLITMKGKTLDELTYTNRYLPARNVTLVGTKGAAPRPTVSPTVSPAAETRTPVVSATVTPKAATTPTPAARPTEARLPNGQIKVPALVGMPEAQARALVDQAGLANTYTNYQGAGQVPPNVLGSVAVGSVLSQNPAPGAVVAAGTTVYLAVRKG